MAVPPLQLNRSQLATFLKDHNQIKQFERLFLTVEDMSASTAIEEAGINAQSALSRAGEALDAAQRLQSALDALGAISRGGNNSLATDYIDLPVSAPAIDAPRRLRWNDSDETLNVGLSGGSVLQVGQEMLYHAKNTSGAAIADGTPVMFTGAVGASGKLKFGLAVADGTAPSEYMMGVATQDVADNGFGYITDFGLVRGINTTGAPYGETWADGDLLYFGAAAPGTWTKTPPAAPAIHVPVAVVVNAASGGSGSIFVRMDRSHRLAGIQDVAITSAANGDLLTYDASNGTWENRQAGPATFRLSADRTAFGPAISDVLNGSSAVAMEANGVYEICWDLYFLKTTAGTLTFSLASTVAPANVVANVLTGPMAGIQASGTKVGFGIVAGNSTSIALPATTSPTTGTNQHVKLTALVEAGASASNIRLRVTQSAGTMTMRRGSSVTVRRVLADSTGQFVA